MSRAAAVIAAQDIQTYNGTSLDPANGFFYTPAYDLLNQQPLANNTFTPPTKSNQAFNLTTLSGMLVPRIEMSSSAWLKCYIENHSFFTQFNAAYYAAVTADPTAANDVNRLRSYAKSADPQVELQDFDAWFEQQYVLDTSVTPGPKLYSYVQPTFPSTSQNNDSGAAIFLIYYQTDGTGDETDLADQPGHLLGLHLLQPAVPAVVRAPCRSRTGSGPSRRSSSISEGRQPTRCASRWISRSIRKPIASTSRPAKPGC